MADGVDRLVEKRAGDIEDQQRLAAVALFRDRRLERPQEAGIAGMAEADALALGHPLGRPQERQPAVVARAHVKRGLDRRRTVAATPRTDEMGGNDLGVVEDQRVARFEQRRQVPHDPVGQAPVRADVEQPRGVARFRGPQRDPVFGEFEIEQVDAHVGGNPVAGQVVAAAAPGRSR